MIGKAHIIPLCYLLSLLSFSACNHGQSDDPSGSNMTTLFTRMDSSLTGINFKNTLSFDEKFNIYKYRNFYNGGGVAIGDINNDSLPDIFFTSNMERNKLYLNKGDFHFKDITEIAEVGGTHPWSTGVTMADVNSDGWMDIYVCNSGNVAGDNKKNELYINNSDGTFTEKAEEYGLADSGLSTHAVFFDYDKDGDLDLYLLNNSFQAIGGFDLQKNMRNIRDSIGGDKLYKNTSNRFEDVSEAAGIYGSVIAFGLGITIGDYNRDSWPDIYISNDFFEKDYLYMNNGDGTFSEKIEEQMRSISAASMGADMGDINNDGWPDIFVTDMLPEPESRVKTVTTFESWDRYKGSVENGYYHQFTRNMLHLNNGNNTFSEVGRLANIHATDWSWGALIADFDNDGFKDLFVANGIYQDLTNQDYLRHISNESTMRSIISDSGVDFRTLIDVIPSVKVPNYAFKNNGGLHFENKAVEWGLGEPSHSNGAAYGDLDNDGDLDLIVNNVNMPAFIYRNESDNISPNNHYLGFKLKGEKQNLDAIGAKITIKANGQLYYHEHMPMRGFQSTMDNKILIGLGSHHRVDSVFVEWPDGRHTLLKNVKTNAVLTLTQSDAKVMENDVADTEETDPLFTEINYRDRLKYKHTESDFSDFERSRLLFHMRSTEGPATAIGDLNGDGLDDIFLGGAKGFPGVTYLQDRSGSFTPKNKSLFTDDQSAEDVSSTFFDADGDGDLDLYVVSGSNEFSSGSTALRDRLYFNKGNGILEKSAQSLPTSKFESTAVARPQDFDHDGDIDLFVGGRMELFAYGVPSSSYLLENDGKGNFTNVTQEKAPGLSRIGLVTDALWKDLDNDADQDLIIVGEWMPITIMINENGNFVNKTVASGLKETNGWWNKIASADIDQDGDMDFIVGNHGLNSRLKASPEAPLVMHVNDFDNNGSAEQILSTFNLDNTYPLPLMHDMMMQIPALEKKYDSYASYAGQTLTDYFTPQQLENSVALNAYELRSMAVLNNGDDTFSTIPLPLAAQYSPVYGICIDDFNGDGIPDVVLGGNLHRVKPEMGRYDANYGLFLKGKGNGHFEAIRNQTSGLNITGEVRDIITLTIRGKKHLMVVRNGDSPVFYTY